MTLYRNFIVVDKNNLCVWLVGLVRKCHLDNGSSMRSTIRTRSLNRMSMSIYCVDEYKMNGHYCIHLSRVVIKSVKHGRYHTHIPTEREKQTHMLNKRKKEEYYWIHFIIFFQKVGFSTVPEDICWINLSENFYFGFIRKILENLKIFVCRIFF